MPPTPHPVDVHVGNRIRMRRTLLGLNMESLGEAIGLSFQQVQKYEHGTNRVSSSRLYDMARVLGVPVSFFFEDIPVELAGGCCGRDESAGSVDNSAMSKRETLELIRGYLRIRDPAIRRKVLELMKSLGEPDGFFD